MNLARPSGLGREVRVHQEIFMSCFLNSLGSSRVAEGHGVLYSLPSHFCWRYDLHGCEESTSRQVIEGCNELGKTGIDRLNLSARFLLLYNAVGERGMAEGGPESDGTCNRKKQVSKDKQRQCG